MFTRRIWILLIALMPTFIVAQDVVPEAIIATPLSVTTTVDANGHELVTLTIPAKGDQVAWADVGTAIVRAVELNDAAISDMLPSGSISLRSPTASLILVGAGIASKGDLKFTITQDATGNSALTIVCDRTAVKQRRMLKADALVKPSDASLNVGLSFDDGWQSAPLGSPLLVCVHGYSSGPGTFSQLRKFMNEQQLSTASFGYDFHQAIESSAKQLAAACLEIKLKDPNRKIVLAGHSMGGLVGRSVLELPGLDPGNVVRLITIASPHCGSMWAHCPPLLTARGETGFDMNQVAKLLIGATDDPGFNDLKPESPFLRRLNSLPRNTNIKYTVIIGTKGPLSEEEARELRGSYSQWKTESRFVQLVGPKFDPLMEDLEEVTHGLGDGAVAICRTGLDGVDDVVSLSFSHSEVLRPATGDDSGAEKVWQVIVDRCRR